LDVIFPLECVACGAPAAHVCAACLASVALAPRFFGAAPARTAAGYAYAHPLVRRLLHDAKYEGWRCALGPIETLMRRWAVKSSGLFPEEAVVVPVPLHPSRLRARGFNQSEALARAYADATGRRTAEGILARIRRTRPQTETDDRAANVRGAFIARHLPASLRGRPFLLVDDVRTTGATMDGCAEALRAAGAGEVHGVALAWGSGTKEDAGT
ncbi:MAG TPA: phosphoribosyltransferase family protein, partial [Patescibacteria group bacterium]|nr:phosphoribosyltransferase family protein [Patescibacteria group bacterium]